MFLDLNPLPLFCLEWKKILEILTDVPLHLEEFQEIYFIAQIELMQNYNLAQLAV